MSARRRVAVLASGRGTNLAALVAAAADAAYPAEICGVLCNVAGAPALARAAEAGIPAVAIPHRDYSDKGAHEAAVDDQLHEWEADIVCLAGYMRLFSPGFTKRWEGRMINIHPSILPLFRGLDTHRRALEAGMRLHGCTVHFVTAEMDGGPIIAQAAVAVGSEDDEAALAARVLAAEHRLYPFALALVASGKARMEDGLTVLEGISGPEGQFFSPDISAPEVDLESLARMTP